MSNFALVLLHYQPILLKRNFSRSSCPCSVHFSEKGVVYCGENTYQDYPLELGESH